MKTIEIRQKIQECRRHSLAWIAVTCIKIGWKQLGQFFHDWYWYYLSREVSE